MREDFAINEELMDRTKRKDTDDKMKTMIREILFYVVFLLLLLIVANGQQDINSFRKNQHLINKVHD